MDYLTAGWADRYFDSCLKLYRRNAMGVANFNEFFRTISQNLRISAATQISRNAWAYYRPGMGKFEAEDIDPNLCSRITYAFFGIEPSGSIKVADEWLSLDSGLGMIRKTIELKRKNPLLRVTAAIGGWNEGSEKFSGIAADSSKRNVFIQSTLELIRKHKFDGVEIDWLYPTQRGGIPQDKQNFVTLLGELSSAFKKENRNLELTIGVGAGQHIAGNAYDIPNIAKKVDFINLMTYDMNESNRLSFHTPLRGQGGNNVTEHIQHWLRNGVASYKLLLGLAFYGRHFSYNDSPTPGSPCTGPGPNGPLSQNNGSLGYNEICGLDDSYTTEFDLDCRVPYSYNGTVWIGYDNPASISEKIQLVKDHKLSGVMIWSIDYDDFSGQYGENYPLLKKVKSELSSIENSQNN